LVTDYRDWQIPLGRRFRALKIWFVMRSYGLDGMKEHIRKHIAIGEVLTNLVKDRNDLFEIIATPRFALTCFRVKPSVVAGLHMNSHADPSDKIEDDPLMGELNPAADEQRETDANVVTKEITDIINENGEIVIRSTTTVGKSVMRVVSANPNAEEKYVRNAFDIIVRTTEEVLGKRHTETANARPK